ncbi:hypothetical protein [Sinorhizobium americanum]|uniref:hypothetical protein n=1 Tax=Sinorhizobium americanum TaxID=194963 RepID=UPI0012EB70EC|nr:hypothetical protein [Sinorhizobium americanum]
MKRLQLNVRARDQLAANSEVNALPMKTSSVIPAKIRQRIVETRGGGGSPRAGYAARVWIGLRE